MDNSKKISVRQTFALILLEVIGVGFVAIPKLALMLAWRDGFTAIVLSSLVSAVYTAFIIRAINKYNGKAFFDICDYLLGTIAGRLIRCGFIIKSVLICGFCMRMFAHTVTKILESSVPVGIIMLTLMLCILYCVFKGRQTRGRLAELFTLPFVLVLVFILICGIPGSIHDELLPVLSEGGRDIISCTASVFMWFYPIEFVLISLPYIDRRENLSKYCALSILTAGLITASVFALTLMRFGAPQMRAMNYPVLEMMYSVNLPGSFIERQEGLMLGLWITGVFFAIGGGIYHSGKCGSELFKGISPRIASLICAIFALITAFLPSSGAKAEYYMINVLFFAESIYLLALPLILCFGLLWEGQKNENRN